MFLLFLFQENFKLTIFICFSKRKTSVDKKFSSKNIVFTNYFKYRGTEYFGVDSWTHGVHMIWMCICFIKRNLKLKIARKNLRCLKN